MAAGAKGSSAQRRSAASSAPLKPAARSRLRARAGDGLQARVLTAEQDARAVRALAAFKAKREAFNAGVPLEQLYADVWIVHVDSADAEVA